MSKMTKAELISLIEKIVDERIKYHLSVQEIKQGNTQKSTLKQTIKEEVYKDTPLPTKFKNSIMGSILEETKQQMDAEFRKRERILNDTAPITTEQQLSTLTENMGDAAFSVNNLQGADLGFLTKNYSSTLKKMKHDADKSRPV